MGSKRRRLDSIVSVRFSPAEVDELRRRAAIHGMTMSGYLRWLIQQPVMMTRFGNQTITNIVPTSVTRNMTVTS
jgi:hypothetical protein